MTGTKRRSRDIWYTRYRYERNLGQRHRVVAIEYMGGWPRNVLTEHHWDHTGEPWFKPGRDNPNGVSINWWDFDWCKRDQTLHYHQSGCGGEVHCCVARFCEPVPPKAQLWVAAGLPVVVNVGRTDNTWGYRPVGDAELLRMGYERIVTPRRLPLVDCYPYRKAKTTLNPFEAGWEGETVWCDRCQDHLPDGDTNRPCEHIAWCDECGMWVYTDDQTYVESSSGKHDCPNPDDNHD